jgi:hypothetical protein
MISFIKRVVKLTTVSMSRKVRMYGMKQFNGHNVLLSRNLGFHRTLKFSIVWQFLEIRIDDCIRGWSQKITALLANFYKWSLAICLKYNDCYLYSEGTRTQDFYASRIYVHQVLHMFSSVIFVLLTDCRNMLLCSWGHCVIANKHYMWMIALHAWLIQIDHCMLASTSFVCDEMYALTLDVSALDVSKKESNKSDFTF